MFLDLIIWIDRKSQKLKFKPHAKSKNLFLCVLPRSAHSCNSLKGMIRNMIGRVWRHSSDKIDYTKEVSLMHQKSTDVGHNPTSLATIFKEAAPKL